jgi:hypothetical protein
LQVRRQLDDVALPADGRLDRLLRIAGCARHRAALVLGQDDVGLERGPGLEANAQRAAEPMGDGGLVLLRAQLPRRSEGLFRQLLLGDLSPCP